MRRGARQKRLARTTETHCALRNYRFLGNTVKFSVVTLLPCSSVPALLKERSKALECSRAPRSIHADEIGHTERRLCDKI